jgi:hypothetical protein
LPADQIDPTFAENRAAAFHLIEELLSPPAVARHYVPGVSFAESAAAATRDPSASADMMEIVVGEAVIRMPLGADGEAVAGAIRAVRSAMAPRSPS